MKHMVMLQKLRTDETFPRQESRRMCYGGYIELQGSYRKKSASWSSLGCRTLCNQALLREVLYTWLAKYNINACYSYRAQYILFPPNG